MTKKNCFCSGGRGLFHILLVVILIVAALIVNRPAGLLPVAAEAIVEEVTIAASKESGIVGETVRVEITISNARATKAGLFDLSYDPAIVKLVKVNEGALISDAHKSAILNVLIENGHMLLIWITPEGDTAESGVICTIEYELLSEGESDLIFNNLIIEPEEIKTSTSNPGRITVSGVGGGNADLSALTVSIGTLTPAFAPTITAYTVAVSHDVSSVDIIATLSDASTTMTIDGNTAISGNAQTIKLGTAGTATTIAIRSTAEDGITKKTYTVTVNREELPLPLTPPPPTNDPEPDPVFIIKLGDITGKGKNNVEDATLVMQHILGLKALTPNQQKAADVNGDGTINIVDVVLIMKKAVGLIDKYPTE